MFDFELTESGDIILKESSRSKETLDISFIVSENNALHVSFYTEGNNIKRRRNTLAIIFSIGDDLKEFHEVKVNIKNQMITQTVKNKLKTTIGELKQNKEFGSRLEVVKHERMFNKKVMTETKQIIKEAIKDILPECDVMLTPKVYKNHSYVQKLEIEILNEGKLIFRYSI